MSRLDLPRLVVFVGSGGVGKTTVAAATGVLSAREGVPTLVMTFDPSHRLRQALGVGVEAAQGEVAVPLAAPAPLAASLLDARITFDRLVARHAPSAEIRDRILRNRFYRQLAGKLAGILEYMAVERLFEVRAEGRYERIVLDTPPTRQAMDFLAAPRRIVDFLDSGAVRLALRPWFAADGTFRSASRLPLVGRRLESAIDDVMGLDLLRDMAEFFRAFDPLFAGFRARALEVERLLQSKDTGFILIAGAGEERIAESLFFARHLIGAGCRLLGVLVNRVHPSVPEGVEVPRLLTFLAERDARGLVELGKRLGEDRAIWRLPVLAEEPGNLPSLVRLSGQLGTFWCGTREGA